MTIMSCLFVAAVVALLVPTTAAAAYIPARSSWSILQRSSRSLAASTSVVDRSTIDATTTTTPPTAANDQATTRENNPGCNPLNSFGKWHRQKQEACNEYPLDDDDDDEAMVVDFLDLMFLALAGATSNNDQAKRRELVKRLEEAGGYCLVRFDDAREVSTVNGMWNCLGDIFQNENGDMEDAAGYGHQTLDDKDIATDQQTTGYQFLQTQLGRDGDVTPRDVLEHAVGTHGANQALDVYQLFSQLCKAFAVVLYSGTTGVESGSATEIVTKLLDDDTSSAFTGSYHRLCQYVKVSQQSDEEPVNLRSHADWTVTTCVPVSSIAGLEIFDSTLQQWTRPEVSARKLWCEQNSSEKSDDSMRWNSQYVVLFTGIWLELLTKGAVPATIHRVMDRRQDKQEQRQSAPFFMRPRERAFAELGEFGKQQQQEQMGQDRDDQRQNLNQLCEYINSNGFLASVE